MDKAEKQQPKPFGKTVLLCFVLFFLGIMVVNAVFAYKAVTTHTGQVVENPYERGLNYNQVLEDAARVKEAQKQKVEQ